MATLVLAGRHGRSIVTHTRPLTLITVKYIKYYPKSSSCSDLTVRVDVSLVCLAPGFVAGLVGAVVVLVRVVAGLVHVVAVLVRMVAVLARVVAALVRVVAVLVAAGHLESVHSR